MAFYSATLVGVRPLAVEIEIDLSPGLPFFQIVGLPDAILRESRTRVKSAVTQAGFEFPYDKRVVLNLAPSKVKKEGSGFELGLAARILASSGQIEEPPGDTLFLGELALDGSVRSVPEVNALLFAAAGPEVDRVVVPRDGSIRGENHGLIFVTISHIDELKNPEWWRAESRPVSSPAGKVSSEVDFGQLSFSPFWARLLTICCVGRHHTFLCGPPGCGKTFFAESLRHLTALTAEYLEIPESIQTERRILDSIFDRAGDEVPWAAPHHTASAVGLIGGGQPPRPGAATRAHGGILFLDEMLEFSGAVLDTLREPLERGSVDVYRAGAHVNFPSQFQLVAAANPCRCGRRGSKTSACQCGQSSRLSYVSRMSGPLFDRFEIKVYCPSEIKRDESVSGLRILNEVIAALDHRRSRPALKWSPSAIDFKKRHSIGRGFRHANNVASVAETLAHLSSTQEVTDDHVAEALKYQDIKELELVL